MKRLPLVLAALAAICLVGFLAAHLLSGSDPEPRPDPVPRKPVKEEPAPTRGEDEVPKTVDVQPDPVVVPDEPVVDPDAYPWSVPEWWKATESKLRDTEMHWATQSWKMVDLLKRASEETGLRCRVGPTLRSWANRNTFKLKRFDGTAWELLEGLALRNNIQMEITEGGLLYHQRGRAPESPHFHPGLVQQTITHARERRAGKREEHATRERMLTQVVDPVGEGQPVALRDALPLLGKKVRVPVYVDEALWKANPSIGFPGERASLAEILDLGGLRMEVHSC
ncbi:MAG: hypothetical protein ACYTDX_03360 [Planctomycetota bacterium]|jgi:hypothetical protein